MSGRPSDIRRLPDELRKKIEHRLSEPGFIDYEGLADQLRLQGYEISAGSLRRFGTSRPRVLEATGRSARHRRSKAQALPTDPAMTETLVQLTQEKLRSVLAKITQLKQGDMSRLAHAVAHLTQAAISLQRWSDEHRQRTKLREGGDPNEKSQPRGGLSSATSQSLRNALLGIAPAPADPSHSRNAARAGKDAKLALALPITDEVDNAEGAKATGSGPNCDPPDDDIPE
jgi:hypothetical protein